nr:hypothetical protein [Tanacetum cinerariifolium]
MDLIVGTDPTIGLRHESKYSCLPENVRVSIGERQRDEDEPKLLETTVGRVVPLLPVEQGDPASGGHGVGIDVVTETIIKDVAPAQLKRQKKQKTNVADAGEPSHPAKKLRHDYGAPGGPTVGGKSQLSIQRLFVGAMQNAKVRGGIMPTFPFVSSSVSTTPEREDGDHTKLLAGANIRAIGAPQWFVISSDSSDHSSVNFAKAEVDSVVRTSMPIITSATTTPTDDPVVTAKEKLVGSSVFGADSPSAGESHPISGGFSDCSGSDFLIGGDPSHGGKVLPAPFYYHCWTQMTLTHGMELAIAKCLNSPEYLSAIGTAVSKAIEKGMQDGLAAGIIHGREGRVLTDVAAHNPAAEADASIDVVMNIRRLEEHLVARLGLNESQPHADQLMVPIHHSPDKTVVGAFALSLALDVSDARVRRIRENIMSHKSLFQDVFVPLAEHLSVAALIRMEGTSGAAPATADLTTALSVTLASASTVTPLSVDDYGVMGTDDQSVVNESVVDEDANLFPNVDDAELNIP